MPENQTRFADLAGRYKCGPLVLHKSVVATCWSVEIHKKSFTEEGHLGCVHRLRILEKPRVVRAERRRQERVGWGPENGHLSGFIIVTDSMEPGKEMAGGQDGRKAREIGRLLWDLRKAILAFYEGHSRTAMLFGVRTRYRPSMWVPGLQISLLPASPASPCG